MYRSRDDGERWEAVNTGLTNLFVRALLVHDEGKLLAGTTYGGVFQSQDDGDTWQALSDGLPEVDVRTLLAMDDGRLFAGAFSGLEEEVHGGIFRFSEENAQWEVVDIAPQSVDVLALSMTTTGDVIAGTAFGGIYRSQDRGENWQVFTMGFSHSIVSSLVSTGSGGVYAGLVYGGLYRSMDDGESWQALTNGLVGETVHDLAVSLSGVLVVEVNPDRLFFSNDEGETWHGGHTRQGGAGALGFTAAGTLLAGSTDGVIYRTEDEGVTWTTSSVPIANTPQHYCSGNVRSFVFNDQGDLFAGARCGGVFRSQDDGRTWQAMNNGLTDLRVSQMALTPNGDLYAGTEGSMFRSQDNGENWTEISDGLADDLVRVTSIVFTAEGEVYTMTYHGKPDRVEHVYRFDSVQQRWDPLPDVSDGLSDLAINTRGYLFAGTYGDGVYRSDVSLSPGSHPTAVEQVGEDIPQGFLLAQNYPNPFNPQTRITFQQATENDIQLVVYNTLGQVVRRLIDRRYPAGTFRAEWEGRDDAGQTVASGVYFYRLTAGSFTEVRTMVLLR